MLRLNKLCTCYSLLKYTDVSAYINNIFKAFIDVIRNKFEALCVRLQYVYNGALCKGFEFNI